MLLEDTNFTFYNIRNSDLIKYSVKSVLMEDLVGSLLMLLKILILIILY